MSVIINNMAMPQNCNECRMMEIIDREDGTFRYICIAHLNEIVNLKERLDTCPLEEVQEPKPRKWIYKDGGWHCSLCDEQAPFWCMASTQNLSNYCPNCGAKMERSVIINNMAMPQNCRECRFMETVHRLDGRERYICIAHLCEITDLKERLDTCPLEEVQEPKPRKWIYKDWGWHCSLCDEQAPFWCMASTQNLSNYCPNCGAKMERSEDGET